MEFFHPNSHSQAHISPTCILMKYFHLGSCQCRYALKLVEQGVCRNQTKEKEKKISVVCAHGPERENTHLHTLTLGHKPITSG